MVATVKTEDQLRASCSCETSEGFHFRFQHFPKESLEFCGQAFEFELIFTGVYACKVDDDYHFFSEDALITPTN